MLRTERSPGRRTGDGEVNALVKPFGDGRVGVVGSHPEADRSWYTDRLWAQDKDGGCN